MTPMSLRIGDLEVRTCDEQLLTRQKPHCTADIVRWERDDQGGTCYTLAYWRKHEKDGRFDLMIVADRPFAYSINYETFWQLARYGDEYLSRYGSQVSSEVEPDGRV